tara:strand:+ start:359 stop:532 length:174 start_codon:yes stop_codon:yes gene_type:complete
MNITSAQYITNSETNKDNYIKATVDGEVIFVPVVSDNRHYKDLLEWVAEGNKIEDAD